MNFDIMFKDTLNRRVCVVMATKNEEILRKPDWLKIKLIPTKTIQDLRR
ncbi:lipoic acid synthetase [Staphylococcus aureus]|nr:lipoic acid synthetase [Staphylococcus aureus]